MMLRILKITGDSMSPDFQEGDYVVIATGSFFLRRLKIGDVIVFRHGGYGTLIKKIDHFDEDGSLIVSGTREDSLDSRRLGPIALSSAQGKVIWHFHN